MTLLAINTASSRTAIALINDGEIIAENFWQSQNDEAEKLMPAIYELTNSQNYDQVLVIKGPGSFTGLRIGVTVANTIAHLNKYPLYAIDTFEYWHLANDLPILVFAGKGGVYLKESPESEPYTVDLPELNETLKAKAITKVTGDISQDQKDMLEIDFIETSATFGEIIKNLDLNSLAPISLVKPHYIKAPSITLSKKICST